jgi:hypothetical protein
MKRQPRAKPNLTPNNLPPPPPKWKKTASNREKVKLLILSTHKITNSIRKPDYNPNHLDYPNLVHFLRHLQRWRMHIYLASLKWSHEKWGGQAKYGMVARS